MEPVTPLILAGGFGTRLKPLFPDIPKVLVPVNRKPFIFFLLAQIKKAGFKHVILCTGYKANLVEGLIGKQHGGLKITYSTEKEPLGTGGALRKALGLVSTQHSLVMNGDTWVDIKLADYVQWFLKKQCEASVVLSRSPDKNRYGQVEIDEADKVLVFEEKKDNPGKGLVNAGIYQFKTSLLEEIPPEGFCSLETEFLPGIVVGRMYGFSTKKSFIDIGTPDSHAAANHFFSNHFKGSLING